MTKHDHHTDENFMARALELASLGQGHVSPNPLVGSVIVHDGKIIGEGWHKKYGGPHAEVNAVNNVVDKSAIERKHGICDPRTLLTFRQNATMC